MVNSRDDKGSTDLELATFLGDWRDSMGNNVNVDWAKSHGSRGELDVSLSTKSGKTIALSVKSRGAGRFQCGHYNLDVEESNSDRIVWVDFKESSKTSTWKRIGGSWDNRGSDRGWAGRDGDTWKDRTDHGSSWKRDNGWKQGESNWNHRDKDSWKSDRQRDDWKDWKKDDEKSWNSNSWNKRDGESLGSHKRQDHENDDNVTRIASLQPGDSLNRLQDVPHVVVPPKRMPQSTPGSARMVASSPTIAVPAIVMPPPPATPPPPHQPHVTPGEPRLVLPPGSQTSSAENANPEARFALPPYQDPSATNLSFASKFGSIGVPQVVLPPVASVPKSEAAPHTLPTNETTVQLESLPAMPGTFSAAFANGQSMPAPPHAIPTGHSFPSHPPPPPPHAAWPVGSPSVVASQNHPSASSSVLPHPDALQQHQPSPNHVAYPLYQHHAGHLGYPGYHGGYEHSMQSPFGQWPGHTQSPPQQTSHATIDSSKPTGTSHDAFSSGNLVCDGGRIICDEGNIIADGESLVVDGGNIVVGDGILTPRAQHDYVDDFFDGPIVCDGGNLWIGESSNTKTPPNNNTAPDNQLGVQDKVEHGQPKRRRDTSDKKRKRRRDTDPSGDEADRSRRRRKEETNAKLDRERKRRRDTGSDESR